MKSAAFVLAVILFGAGSLAQAIPIDEIQISTGGSSGRCELILDQQELVHISYVSSDISSGWGSYLAYAQVEGLTVQNQNLIPPQYDFAGPARLLPRPEGGVALFHHQWSNSVLEQFIFTPLDETGAVLDTVLMTTYPGCTNTDSYKGEMDLGDSTFGFVYTSCRNTGVNTTDRNNLFYSRLTSQGTELVGELQIDSTTYIYSGGVAEPSGSGSIHITYHEWGSGGIDSLRYLQIDYDGNILVPSKGIGASGIYRAHDMVVDAAGLLHVYWMDDATGTSQVYRTVLSSAGVSQIPPTQITSVTGGVFGAIIASIDDNDIIHLQWRAGAAGLYSQMDVFGNTVFGPDTLEVSVPIANITSMEVDGSGRGHIAWLDTTQNIRYGRFETGLPTDVQANNGELPARRPTLIATPNPFNPVTTLRYNQTAPSHLEMAIYDLSGRRVVILVDESIGAGVHEAVWNGTNARGQAVPSGRYFARIRTQTFSETIPITLLQ